MSIYPVKLAEWFPKGDPMHSIMKVIVQCSTCYYCGKKKLHWQKAYGHHALPYGCGEVWHSERCYKAWLRRIR